MLCIHFVPFRAARHEMPRLRIWSTICATRSYRWSAAGWFYSPRVAFCGSACRSAKSMRKRTICRCWRMLRCHGSAHWKQFSRYCRRTPTAATITRPNARKTAQCVRQTVKVTVQCVSVCACVRAKLNVPNLMRNPQSFCLNCAFNRFGLVARCCYKNV